MAELPIELIQKCIFEGDKCLWLDHGSKLKCAKLFVVVFTKFYGANAKYTFHSDAFIALFVHRLTHIPSTTAQSLLPRLYRLIKTA